MIIDGACLKRDVLRTARAGPWEIVVGFASLVLVSVAQAQLPGLGAADPSQQLKTMGSLGPGARPTLPEKRPEPLVLTEPPVGATDGVTVTAAPEHPVVRPVHRATPRVATPAPRVPIAREPPARRERISDLLDRVKRRRSQR